MADKQPAPEASSDHGSERTAVRLEPGSAEEQQPEEQPEVRSPRPSAPGACAQPQGLASPSADRPWGWWRGPGSGSVLAGLDAVRGPLLQLHGTLGDSSSTALLQALGARGQLPHGHTSRQAALLQADCWQQLACAAAAARSSAPLRADAACSQPRPLAPQREQGRQLQLKLQPQLLPCPGHAGDALPPALVAVGGGSFAASPSSRPLLPPPLPLLPSLPPAGIVCAERPSAWPARLVGSGSDSDSSPLEVLPLCCPLPAASQPPQQHSDLLALLKELRLQPMADEHEEQQQQQQQQQQQEQVEEQQQVERQCQLQQPQLFMQPHQQQALLLQPVQLPAGQQQQAQLQQAQCRHALLPPKHSQPGEYPLFEANPTWCPRTLLAAAEAGAAQLGVPLAPQARPPASASDQRAPAAPCFGVLMLAHEKGVAVPSAWAAWEDAQGGRAVVRVHLKAGVELAGLPGSSWLAGRLLVTRLQARWGCTSLTAAILAGAAELIRAQPALQHVAIVSGQDVPVASLPPNLPAGLSICGRFRFGAVWDAAARAEAAALLQEQLGMAASEAAAWGSALMFHHTWMVLDRRLLLALLSRQEELLAVGSVLHARFMQDDAAVAADEFLLLSAAGRYGFLRSVERRRLSTHLRRRRPQQPEAGGAAEQWPAGAPDPQLEQQRGADACPQHGRGDRARLRQLLRQQQFALQQHYKRLSEAPPQPERPQRRCKRASDCGSGSDTNSDSMEQERPRQCQQQALHDGKALPGDAGGDGSSSSMASSQTAVLAECSAASAAASEADDAAAASDTDLALLASCLPAAARPSSPRRHRRDARQRGGAGAGPWRRTGGGAAAAAGVASSRHLGVLLDAAPTLALFHPSATRHPHAWHGLAQACLCDVRGGEGEEEGGTRLTLPQALQLAAPNGALFFRKVEPCLGVGRAGARLLECLQALWAGKPLRC